MSRSEDEVAERIVEDAFDRVDGCEPDIEGDAEEIVERDTNTGRLFNRLPPAMTNPERDVLVGELITARGELWAALSRLPSVWAALRQRLLAAQAAQLGGLLERPVHDDAQRLRAAVLSGIDRALCAGGGPLLEETAAHVVPRHQLLLALLADRTAVPDTQRAALGAIERRLSRIEGKLLAGSMRLAAHIVRKTPGAREEHYDDLLQDGMLAMQEAYRRLTLDSMANATSYAGSYAAYRIRDGLAVLRGISRRCAIDNRLPTFLPLDKIVSGTADVRLEDTLADAFDWAEVDAEHDLKRMRKSFHELPLIQQRVLNAAFQLDGQSPVRPATIAQGLGVPVDVVIGYAHDGVRELRRKLVA